MGAGAGAPLLPGLGAGCISGRPRLEGVRFLNQGIHGFEAEYHMSVASAEDELETPGLGFQFPEIRKTLLEGVQSLLPGETWQFDLSHRRGPLVPQRSRYWRPAFVARTERPPRHPGG